MSDDDPAAWGAKPVAQSEDDPASWGAKPVAATAPADGFSWSQAITDVPSEIGKEAGTAISDIAALRNRSQQGPIEGLLTTGKAALAVPRLLASPITGAARSLIGHPMANIEHAAGTLINPEVAAKDNPQQMYETAKSDVDLAMSAARPAGVPVKVAGVPTAPKPAYEWKAPPSQGPKPVGLVDQPETEAFFDAANNNYANMRGYGVEIDPAAMNRVADNITTELMAEGYRPRNVPKVFDAIEELRKPAGQNHEISDIDSVRKVLNKARLDHTERDAARRAVGHIDDYLANLHNNTQDVVVNPHYAGKVAEEAMAARGNYAVAKRAEDIDEALDQAERQAARSGAGGNINNAIRQRLSSLRNNKKKMAGWTDAEKAELDSVINGTALSNAARKAGKFAPHGIVSTVMSAGAGHVLMPGVGEVAIPAVGLVSKMIGDRLTKNAAERLSNVVKSRSPLGKQTSINAAAQSAFQPPSGPRLLPSGIAAGLPHPVGPIPLRQIQGVMGSAAEDQQQGPGRGNNQPDQGINNQAHGGRVYARGGKVAAEKALPPDHQLGMRVPKGGSMCANCHFLASDTTCGNDGFVKWNGSEKLPAPKNEYCCDNYQKRTERARGGAVHNHNPTEPQKKAGNYSKTHRYFQGLDITLENLKGHSRSGIGKDGKRWSVKMPAHYGYLKRTEGADGDHVDVYLGPNEKSDQVFVVDQKDAETGRFDEHKCLLGFSSEKEALKTYRAGFSDGKDRVKHIRRMTMAEFRTWLDKGDTSKPIKHHEAALRLAYEAKRGRDEKLSGGI